VKAISDFVIPFDRAASARIAYKASVDTAAKAAMFVVTVMAARALPRDAFGVLALALTAGWLLGVASDAGLPMYLARVAARGDPHLRATLSLALRLRLLLAIAALGIAVALGWHWTPPGTRVAFALIVVSQLAGAALETVGHALRGMDRSELEAHVHLAQRLAMTAAALLVLMAAPSLNGLAWALALPPLVALPVMIGVAVSKTKPGLVSSELRGKPDPVLLLLRDAAPLGVGVLLSALYFRIDVFFVERWHGLEAVAGYNAVFRIVDAVRLLPAAVLAVTFPLLCRANDVTVVRKVAASVGAVGVAVAAGVGLAAPALVTALYGAAYVDASPALRTLACAVPLFFLNYALTHQVIGWKGQREYVGIAAAALVANLTANATLVPGYGPVGAAAATWLTEVVVTLGCVWALAESRRTRATAEGLSSPPIT
jgi:O-antigen/teichoic acid export membrane protein